MLSVRAAAVVLALLTAACTTPTSAGPGGPTASLASSTPPAAVLPSFPADANVFHGANTNIVVQGAKHPGALFVDVEAHQTPSGTKVTLLAERQVDCHVDKADPGAPLWLCTSKWSRRKTIPTTAFTYDGNLGTASVTTTVDGKPLTITWAGYGTPRQQVNQNGALLIRHRDAKVTAAWGRLRYTDPDDTKVPSLVYHRVTAST